jgi:predicted HTH domain antitoxin
MSVIIPDEIVSATRMSEPELKQQIAIMLFQTGKLPLGYASKLAEMEKFSFRQLLKSKQIPIYDYDIEDLELDLKNLRELGRI